MVQWVTEEVHSGYHGEADDHECATSTKDDMTSNVAQAFYRQSRESVQLILPFFSNLP